MTVDPRDWKTAQQRAREASRAGPSVPVKVTMPEADRAALYREANRVGTSPGRVLLETWRENRRKQA